MRMMSGQDAWRQRDGFNEQILSQTPYKTQTTLMRIELEF